MAKVLQFETKDFEIATINLLKELKERVDILKEQMANLSEEMEAILYLESTDRTLGGKEKKISEDLPISRAILI